MIGFETIGNATVTVFDGLENVLTTDPWINGNPYFGSWGHKYSIPKEQKENILSAKYIWLSHGHPDHIDSASLNSISEKIFLIPDHYGDRIFNDFKNNKFNCRQVKSNEWIKLSKNIRIKSFADWNQDATLLIEINKDNILLNLNDGMGYGWQNTIKKIIKEYKNRFLLKLINWGDADMLNFYDENDNFINPSQITKTKVGKQYTRYMQLWNCNYAIPFSSMHRYVREDSAHMNKFVTPLSFHYDGFDSLSGELLPAFIRWDVMKNDYVKLKVVENSDEIVSAKSQRDIWSDELNNDEFQMIVSYFNRFDHLKKKFGFLCFKVGNKENFIKLSNKKSGIIFQVPRNSLLEAINHEIFDDLLIGNFMKTTLVNVKSLYPNFSPYVAKYGDNGLSRSSNELEEYFDYYKLNSMDFWSDMLRFKTEGIIRNSYNENDLIFRFSKKIKNLIS